MANITPWSDQEIALLLNSKGKTNKETIQMLLGTSLQPRSLGSVGRKRKELEVSNSNKWTAEEVATLQENYLTMTDQELSNKFFPYRDSTAVAGKRINLGLMKCTQWTDQEIEIVKANYYQGVPLCMSLLPHHDRRAIKWLANSLGLYVNPTTVNRKYTYKEDYFTELTAENCYVAGFIAADGSLHCKKNMLSIILHQQDRCILERFKDYFQYTGIISDREDKRKDSPTGISLTTTLAVYGVTQWYIDLEKHFNIVPTKTKILKAPNLSSMEHKIAYIVGYIDGDGSIFRSGAGKRDKLYCSTLGTESMMRFLKDIFDTLVPIPENGKGRGSLVNLQGKYSFPLHRYTITGKRCVDILQEIKKFDLPFLSRKWDKVPV